MTYTLAVDNGSSESCSTTHRSGTPRMLHMSTIGEECMLTALVCLTPKNPAGRQKEIILVSNALHEIECLCSLSCDGLTAARQRADFLQLCIDLMLAHVDFCSGETLTVCCPDGLDNSVQTALRSFLEFLLVQLRDSSAAWVHDFRKIELVPAHYSTIYSLFKCSPEGWDRHKDHRFTFRGLMQRYLTALLRRILHVNPDEAARMRSADTLRLVLGCPAAEDWLSESSRNAYAALAKECAASLGFPAVQAEIIPEPYAASLSFINGPDKPDLSKGFAVLDAGGITADSIFLKYTSRTMLHPSYSTTDIGGSLIEQRALNLLLDQVGLNALDLPDEQYSTNLLYLRRIKEQYFPHRPDMPEHSLILGDKRVTFFPGALFLQALYVQDQAGRSWIDNVRRFMHSCITGYRTALASHEAIGSEEGFIHTLILTGGTSNVTDLQEICRDHPDVRLIHQDKNVSTSIARGLSMTINEESIHQLERDVLDSARESLDSYTLVDMLTDAVMKHLPAIAADILQTMIARRASCDRNRLIAAISAAMRTSAGVTDAMQEALNQYSDVCADKVLLQINHEARQHYPGQIPTLSTGFIPYAAFSVNLIRHIIPDTVNALVRCSHPDRIQLLSVRQLLALLARLTDDDVLHAAVHQAIHDAMYRFDPTVSILTALTRDALRYLTFHQLEVVC